MAEQTANGNGQQAAEPSNAFGRRRAKLRTFIVDAITEDDLRAVLAKLVTEAKGGNLAAIREVLAWVAGKPGDAPDPDRLDVDAAQNTGDRMEAEARSQQLEQDRVRAESRAQRVGINTFDYL